MTNRPARATAATALALVLLFAAAGPASAGVPPLPGPVQDVADTVNDVVSSDDPVSDAVDAVDDAAGDLTGTEDPVQGTIDDVTGAGEEVVDDVGQTVGDVTGTAHDVVDKAGDAVDDAIDTVDEATGGTIGDIIGRGGEGSPNDGPGRGPGGPRGGVIDPDGLATSARAGVEHGRAGQARATRAGALDAVTAGDRVSLDADAATSAAGPGLAERLRDAAIEATKKLALPLALTVIVLCYVIAQYWADRKDPKLVFAPLDSDHDLLSFQ